MPCCWVCNGCSLTAGCDMKEACCADKCTFYTDGKCSLAEKMKSVLS